MSSEDDSQIICLNNENIKFVSLKDNYSQDALLDENELDERDVVTCFCVHPNNKEIVISTKTGLLRHYNLADKKCLRTMRGSQMPILTMSYDTTGTLVATGSSDKCVRVWDIEKGFCTHSYREHTDIVLLVSFHPDPTRLTLFSSSSDNTIKIYDLNNTAKSLATFKNHVSAPTDLAVSYDGFLLASCGRDKVFLFYYFISFLNCFCINCTTFCICDN
jgi:U3 small nucleolar RNA-associated protein 13